MKKRTILICGLLALTLASCDTNPYDDPIGGGGGNNGSITDPWWTTEGELTFDGDGNVVLDEVDIHITTVVNGDDYAKFQDIVSDFNREYRGQINVTTDTVNQVGFEQAVANRINQNSNAPDLIMSHQKGHKSFANSKLIQPFNEIFDELNIDFSYDNFASNISSYANLDYEDYYFDVPLDAQSMVIYYNKDILKKYSEDGSLPTNREEFFALCREAQEGERKTNKSFNAVALNTEEEFFFWYIWGTALAQNGATFYNPETYKVEWTEANNLQAFKNALNSIREFFYSDEPISIYGQNLDSANNAFFKDNALFLFSLPWSADTIFLGYGQNHSGLSETQIKEEKIGAFNTSRMFALDQTSPNATKIYGDSHAFALSKTVTDINKKAACAIFVNYFTNNVDVGIDWAEAGHISVSNAISSNKEYQDSFFVDNYINNFYPNINDFVTAGNTPYFDVTFDDGVYAIANTLLREETDRKDASTIASIQTDVNDLIDML